MEHWIVQTDCILKSCIHGAIDLMRMLKEKEGMVNLVVRKGVCHVKNRSYASDNFSSSTHLTLASHYSWVTFVTAYSSSIRGRQIVIAMKAFWSRMMRSLMPACRVASAWFRFFCWQFGDTKAGRRVSALPRCRSRSPSSPVSKSNGNLSLDEQSIHSVCKAGLAKGVNATGPNEEPFLLSRSRNETNPGRLNLHRP